jgi:hypothetical protein
MNNARLSLTELCVVLGSFATVADQYARLAADATRERQFKVEITAGGHYLGPLDLLAFQRAREVLDEINAGRLVVVPDGWEIRPIIFKTDHDPTSLASCTELDPVSSAVYRLPLWRKIYNACFHGS